MGAQLTSRAVGLAALLALVGYGRPAGARTDELVVELETASSELSRLKPLRVTVRVTNSGVAFARVCPVTYYSVKVWIQSPSGESAQARPRRFGTGSPTGCDHQLAPGESSIGDLLIGLDHRDHPVFDVPGTYRLTVSVNGVASAVREVTVTEPQDNERAVVEAIESWGATILMLELAPSGGVTEERLSSAIALATQATGTSYEPYVRGSLCEILRLQSQMGRVPADVDVGAQVAALVGSVSDAFPHASWALTLGGHYALAVADYATVEDLARRALRSTPSAELRRDAEGLLRVAVERRTLPNTQPDAQLPGPRDSSPRSFERR